MTHIPSTYETTGISKLGKAICRAVSLAETLPMVTRHQYCLVVCKQPNPCTPPNPERSTTDCDFCRHAMLNSDQQIYRVFHAVHQFVVTCNRHPNIQKVIHCIHAKPPIVHSSPHVCPEMSQNITNVPRPCSFAGVCFRSWTYWMTYGGRVYLFRILFHFVYNKQNSEVHG